VAAITGGQVIASRRGAGSTYRPFHSSGLGYKSPVGSVLWLWTMFAFATAASSLNYTDNTLELKPFDGTQVKFTIAANVLAWLAVSAFIVMDVQSVTFNRQILLGIEGVLALLTFSAACDLMVHFSGKYSYCKYSTASSGHCITYQASAFFTWSTSFLLIVKAYFTVTGFRAETRTIV